MAAQLGEGPFFFGAKPLYCDFAAYHVLNNSRLVDPGVLDPYPNIVRFMAAVEEVPRLKQYLQKRPKPLDIGTKPMLSRI